MVLLTEVKLRIFVGIAVDLVKTKKASAFVMISLGYADHVDVK